MDVESLPLRSANRAPSCQLSPQGFNSFSIYAKIATPQSSRRAHGNEILRRTQMELEIVDEAKDRATAFGVNVMVVFRDDLRARQALQSGAQLAPGSARRKDELKGRD